MTPKLTEEALRATMEDLYKGFHMKQPTSSYVLYAGTEGMDQLSDAIDRQNLLDQVGFILEKKLINEEEQSRLKEMINSSDKESYELAKMIVAEKQRPLYEKYYHKVKTLIGKAWQ